MRKRIFRSMCLSIGVTILLSFITVFAICYDNIYRQMNTQIRSEANYVRNAIEEISDEEIIYDYLDSIKKDSKSRFTLVSEAGIVLFDSTLDAAKMENHKNRPEIAEAFSKGEAFDVRLSTSLRTQTYYYAVRLANGQVLRIAYTSKSMLSLIFNTLPIVAFVYVIVLIFLLLWIKRLTDRIVSPINNIDLKNPSEGMVYEEIKPLVDRINKQNEEQQKNEQLRREFSANVSHELKTPLTSISGYAELLASGMVKDEDVREFAGKIGKESKRLIEIVEDTIRISKLDERKLAIDKEEVNLKEVANEVYNTLLPVAQKHKIELDLKTSDVYVSAVSLMMNELISNLVTNAIKYNKPNGRVTINIFEENDKKLIQVMDTGIGISDEEKDRIFERFYRVDKSHSRQIGGSGLGLAIVKHVVEYHNGEIDVESKVGVGTTVTVSLV